MAVLPMKLLILLLSGCLLALSEQPKYNQGILVLDNLNFKEVIAHNPLVLVKFFAPWCGHCQKLAPEFAKIAQEFKTWGNPTLFAEIDGTENGLITNQYLVQGYPTLVYFINEKPFIYNSTMTKNEISTWANKKSGNLSQLLDTHEKHVEVALNSEVALVYYGESADEPEYKVFRDTAFHVDDFRFYHIFNRSLAEQLGIKATKKIVLYKQFDEKRDIYEGEYTWQSVKEWVAENSQKSVIDFDDRAIDKIFQKAQAALFLFRGKNEESERAYQQFQTAAKFVKNLGVLFCQVNPNNTKNYYNRLIDYMGVNITEFPIIILLKMGEEQQKYIYNQEIKSQQIIQFVQQYISDKSKLEKFLRSQPIPENNNLPVRVVVGKSFEEEVINNDKDVLVKFYAPWCGHCQALAPIWIEVAQKLAHNKNIVLAEFDDTTNEQHFVSIKGYPTIKFWPANAKDKPIDFDGQRTVEGIINWLEEKTTHPWIKAVSLDDL